MAVTTKQLTAFTIAEKKDNNTDVFTVIKKYLYHWPLYIIALAVFALAAMAYLYLTPPSYEINASLLIKDNKNTTEKQNSALHEIELTNSAKIVENEVEIIKSKKLIEQVVKDLNLWVNYKKVDGFKKTDLYNQSPVKFILLNKKLKFDDDKLKIKILDDKSFELKVSRNDVKRYNFDQTYNSSFGSWKLQATNFVKDFKNAEIQIDLAETDDVALNYQKELSSTFPNKDATAVVLIIDDVVPQRGKDFLNGLISNYNLESSNLKNKDTKATLDFLDQKIESLAKELGKAEEGIAGFKSSRGLTDINLQSQVGLQNLQVNDFKLNDINIQLNTINAIDRYVNSSQNSVKVPSVNGINDPALNGYIDKLSQLQLQYDNLSATTPETSPEFESLNKQIATTKGLIKEHVRNIKSNLQSTRDKLQSYSSNVESTIRKLPTQEREFVDIKRQQSSKEGLYTYYLQKREEISAKYAATLSDDRVIDNAYAKLPKSTRNSFAFALAFILGIAAPTSLIFVRNSLSNKILAHTDIKDAIDVPIVAEFPLNTDASEIAINNQSSTAVSEQFRALRTKLFYLHNQNESGRVTLITSSVSGEGKTFISANLSVALALTGRKTIVLELDMRKPKIASLLEVSNDKLGLSDYLLGKASINDIIQNSNLAPDLHVISCGSMVGFPAELLERAAFAKLIEELKARYDDVIIDSPPAHLVPDATIVSAKTDVCLYIIRQSYTEKSELPFIEDLIAQKQLKNVNIVFNGIDKVRYGYGYRVDSSYYTTVNKRTFKSKLKSFFNRF